jgi:3-oxoacyl-[acyl-carrier-protein] synthase II
VNATPRIRVAITGMGVKSPAGNDLPTVTATMLAGRSVAATVEDLVAAGAPVTFGCTVPDFDTTPYCTPRERRRLDRATLLAFAAAADAISQSAVVWPGNPGRAGVSVGIGMGGLAGTEQVVREFGDNLSRIPAISVPKVMANASAAAISMRHGLRGPALTHAAACASGTVAIGEAALRIRSGAVDVMIAGGVDSGLTPVIISGFAHAGALSGRNADPAAASRPFDADRDGFVMGEGAAMMVLERWEYAEARGARILGEVVGYATNADAYHVVAPREDGAAAVQCIRMAVADARIDVAGIGHINAHGTSTLLNDRSEAQALVECFGAGGPPVTASKGVVGHMVGGAGAFEAVVTTCAIADGLVPPVANLENCDVAELLDVVAGEPRPVAPSYALSNSFAFGGHNACLVLGPYR